MENIDVVKKLIGPIDPIGETNTDNLRFDNLGAMCELTQILLDKIGNVARFNKDRGEYSMRKIGAKAHAFLTSNGIEDY